MIYPVYRRAPLRPQLQSLLFGYRYVVLLLLTIASAIPIAHAQKSDGSLSVNAVQVTINATVATTEEDTILAITLLGDGGQPLVFQRVGQGTHGVASIHADGTARYAPELNFNGQDRFTFTASNLSSGTVSGTMEVTVTAVNDAPLATRVSIVTTENNASQGVTPEVTDIDRATAVEHHTFAIVAAPAHGVASVVTAAQAGGQVRLAWDKEDTAKLAGYRIYYVLSAYPADSHSSCPDELGDTEALDVSAPETTATVSKLEAGRTYCFGVKAYDDAGQESQFSNTLRYQLPQVSQLVYTPEPDFNGTDHFSYKATDSQGASVIGIAQVTVTPVYGVPVAVEDRVATAEEMPVTIAVLANDIDVDGDDLTVESAGAALHGTVTIADDNTVRYTPNPDFSGQDTFTYTVSDGSEGTATGIVTVAVMPTESSTVKRSIAWVRASADDGNVPANTLDHDLATRWSAEGDGQWIEYDLGSLQSVAGMAIAWFSGDQRVAFFDIGVSGDGLNWTTAFSGQSSGTTLQPEMIAFSPVQARYVRYIGHMNSANTWNGLTQVDVYTSAGAAVRASADDGNVPANTLDHDLATRWSAEGDGQWIEYDLGSLQSVAGMAIAWFSGDQRVAFFDIGVSGDGLNWTTAFSGQSSGTTLQPEMIAFSPVQARYVRYIGHMNSANTWNGLTQVDVYTSGLLTNVIEFKGRDAFAFRVNDGTEDSPLATVATIVTTSELPNGGFEDNDFTHWTTVGETRVETTAFGRAPTEGAFQAFLSTAGLAEAPEDLPGNAVAASELETFLALPPGSLDHLSTAPVVEGSAVKRTFTARAGDMVSFDWNFLTNERTHLDEPDASPGLDRNDLSFVSIAVDAAPTENILLADSTWTFILASTSFSAETGFDTFSYVLPATGTYTLGIGVADVGDAQLPSGLLLDNVTLTPASP